LKKSDTMSHNGQTDEENGIQLFSDHYHKPNNKQTIFHRTTTNTTMTS
jgi:hypothetical protein